MTPKMRKAVVHPLAKVTMPRHQDNMVGQAGTDNSMADILLSSKVMASLRRHQDMVSLHNRVMASHHRNKDMASHHRNKDMAAPRPSSLATPRNKADTVRHLHHRDIRHDSIRPPNTAD